MSDRFDDEIKKLFGSFEEDYDGSSWDRLSAYMDEHPEVLSDQIDDTLQEKLAEHSVPLRDDDWTVLKTELDLIDEKKERLWLLKGLEVCILALLFFTVDNLTRHTGDAIEYAQQRRSVVEKMPIMSMTASDDVVVSMVAFEHDETESHTTNTKSKISAQANPTSHSTERAVSTMPMPRDMVSTDAHASDHVGEGLSDTHREHVVGTELIKIARLISDISPLPNDAAIDIDLTYAIISDVEDPSKIKYSFELPFSSDINAINSSIVSTPIARRISQGGSGYSIGGLVSYYPSERMSLSSGILYSEKTHAPGRLKSVTKASAGAYLETELDHIDFQQISIPIILRYSDQPYDRSGLYASLGAGVHFITDYQYETRKSIQPSSRVTSFDLNRGIDLTSLPVGLLSQGPVDDNIYFTGILGIGYHMVLPRDAAIFVQPQFQFTLGSGANDYIRRVNTFNLEAGVRFMFIK